MDRFTYPVQVVVPSSSFIGRLLGRHTIESETETVEYYPEQYLRDSTVECEGCGNPIEIAKADIRTLPPESGLSQTGAYSYPCFAHIPDPAE